MIILSLNCSTIDVAVSKKIDIKVRMKKIAVLPFDVKNSKWGDEFADSITHYFFKSGEFEIVEREAIDRILKEQKLSLTGLIEETQAARLGRILGVDVIIMGRGSALMITDQWGNQSKNLTDTFTLKAIHVETGSLFFTVRKEPGVAWDWKYRFQFCCSAGLIWSKKDILKDSTTYDEVSRQIVNKIINAVKLLEEKKIK